MKAFFAIPGDLATASGGYAYARRLLRGAAAAGVELEHVAVPGSFPDPTPGDLAEAARIAAALPPDRPVLVDGLALGAMPAETLDAFRGPVVALCHHPLALETGVDPARAAELAGTERAALARAAAVVTTSDATARILRDDYGVPEHKLTVARPGTDPAPRAPGGAGPACAIVSVGSITPRKGHRRLVAALAGVTDVPWTLRIVGPAPDAAERAALRDDIRRLGLGDRVTLTGPLSATAVAAAYQTADLFVLASDYEGFGMAFTEAMANGLPVLGLDCAAVAEATAGAARLVAAAEFPATLAELVRRPAARAALADRCWRAAAGLPRWQDTVAIVADVLRARAGFSPDWLALRRDADRRARDPGLARTLADALAPRSPIRVLDLGAGAGANLHALAPVLAPVLAGRQRWVLADNDPRLLERIEAPDGVEIAPRLASIPADLGALFDPAPDLVTASAFFDLCGIDVTEQIVARTVAAGAAFYTVLTFDGREAWHTGTGLDDRVLELFLQDQRRDKGMGPALGPDATAHLEQAFRAARYRVVTAPSDWRLAPPADADLIRALAEGHADTARGALGDRARTWLDSAAASSDVLVGHLDLLALPPERAGQ